MNSVSRFLGDSPFRVIVKLVVLSFVVGVVMSALDITPYDLFYRVADFFEGIWEMGFDAIYRFGGYLVIGAMVVVPVFLLLRLLSFRR